MDNNITPEIIERFLKNQSDEAEAERVAAYLEAAPQEILDRYLPDNEWQDGELSGHTSAQLPKEMWQSVAGSAGLFKNRRIVYLKRALAAACIVSVFFAGYYFYSLKNNANTDASKMQVAAALETIGNTTDADLNTVLPDGSELILKPGASVHYYSSFKNKREVYLSGTAFFSVVHDSMHPFVVRANGIATTDLGTKFWILNQEAQQTVTVKLVEGSVVVASLDSSFGMKDVYLKPGQNVVINKLAGTTYVSENKENAAATQALAATKKATHSGSIAWTNAAYTFSKSLLADVFKKLEIRYGVVINVKAADIAECQFTGKIMYSDSLETLIQTICTMNNLTYTKKGDTINIKK